MNTAMMIFSGSLLTARIHMIMRRRKISGRAKKYAAAANPYTKQKYDLYNELVNFKYDPDNDEVFKAYKDMYTREGTAARDRAYSNASARSEGRNNTWAEAAAAQAQNAYTKKISDVVPSLAERAYQKLVNQYNSVNGFETNADKQNQALYKSELEQYKENSDMADKYKKNGTAAAVRCTGKYKQRHLRQV